MHYRYTVHIFDMKTWCLEKSLIVPDLHKYCIQLYFVHTPLAPAGCA
jgi:hypothetical protein